MTTVEIDELQAKRLALSDENDALRFLLGHVLKSWDSLKPGSYDKDIWETWLIQKMKPSIELVRAALGQSTTTEGLK